MTTLTAFFLRETGGYSAFCLEIPGANGQGRTLDSCRRSLRQAVVLMLEEYAVDMAEYLLPDTHTEKLDFDEKTIARSLAYGKRVCASARGKKSRPVGEPGNRRKTGGAAACGGTGHYCREDSSQALRSSKKRSMKSSFVSKGGIE